MDTYDENTPGLVTDPEPPSALDGAPPFAPEPAAVPPTREPESPSTTKPKGTSTKQNRITYTEGNANVAFSPKVWSAIVRRAKIGGVSPKDLIDGPLQKVVDSLADDSLSFCAQYDKRLEQATKALDAELAALARSSA